MNLGLIVGLLIVLAVVTALGLCLFKRANGGSIGEPKRQVKATAEPSKRHRRNKSSTVPGDIHLELEGGTQQVGEEVMPEGWEKKFDASNQTSYFYNSRTDVSVWSIAECT